MPSQAETIAALQGLSPVTTPQSPADPYAAAMTFGSAIGLPDAIKALKGQMTPEEAQMFAVTSAMGMIPGAAPEKAAVKTMGELLPHLYPEASSFAKMTPKEYLGMFGSDLPKQLPQDVENVLKPYMQPTKTGKVPGPGPVKIYNPPDEGYGSDAVAKGHAAWNALTNNEQTYILANHGDIKMSALPGLVAKIGPQLDAANATAGKVTPAQLAKANNQIYPPIDETAISNALAKNPGASIFDVANTHVGGPSMPLNKAFQTIKPDVNLDVPREGGIPFTPLAAKVLGRSENLVHGTRIPMESWKAPPGGGDALQLPYNELGVHFGNPKQAQVFTGDRLESDMTPRTYPVVVQANNPLRMRDLGSWYPEQVTRELGRLNGLPDYKGQFPREELNGLGGDIENIRSYLNDKGYDSVVYKNTEEDPGHDSFIKFTPSPEAPDFVTGVRSPFAAFDPAKIMRPELAAGLAGGTLAAPAIDPNLLKALTGNQTDQQQ